MASEGNGCGPILIAVGVYDMPVQWVRTHTLESGQRGLESLHLHLFAVLQKGPGPRFPHP